MSKRQEDDHPPHQTLEMGDLWGGLSWGKGRSCSCSSSGGSGGGGDERLCGCHW